MGSDLQKLRLSLGGVETPCMGGDNLAVCLASLFEPGIESDELDDSGTWKQGAIDAMDQVLDAVHAHYAARIAELEAALSAANARAEAAERDSAKYRDYAAEKSNQYVQNLHELEMLKADFNDCNSERARHKAAREAAEAEAARLREALVDAAAHLRGAASAYREYAARHRSVGRAKPDPFFTTRVKDFDKAADRAALGGDHETC